MEYADPQGIGLNMAANVRKRYILCGAKYTYMDISFSQTFRTSAKGKNQYVNRERKSKRDDVRIDVTITKVALLRHPGTSEPKF